MAGKPTSSAGILEESRPVSVPVREFIVDVLGSLVPGVTFLAMLGPAFLIPCLSLVRVLEGTGVAAPLFGPSIHGFVTSYRFEILIIYVAISYAVGHIFFRQDPKTPDRKSYLRIREAALRAGKEYDGPADEDCEFPYYNLYDYLKRRGFDHLLGLVRWSKSTTEESGRRSKHFINILKVRLEFLFPNRYGRIARNEAHIRLNSSAWYVSRSLMKIATLGIFLGVTAIVIVAASTGDVWPVQNLRPAVFPVLVLGAAAWSKRRIERVLHYQRVRETVFLLETAYTASKLTQSGTLAPLLFPSESDDEEDEADSDLESDDGAGAV